MADEKFLKEMGARISDRRKQLGLTQEHVAEKMNVSVQMISNLEQGKKAIRPENLAKLCSVISVSADYILSGDTDALPLERIYKKLYTLNDDKLQLIERIIDLCMKDK